MQTQVRDVLEQLREGATVRWLALTGPEVRTSAAAAKPAWVRQIDTGGTGWLSRVTAVFQLSREGWRYRPDIIHARGYNAALLAVIANWRRKPVIFDARGLMPFERIGYGGASASSARARVWLWLEKWMVRSTAATVGVSPPMSDYFRKRSPDSLVETIPLAVDAERIAAQSPKRDAFRHQLGLSSGDVLVVYSGSLAVAGVDALARVMGRIRRGTRNARFLCLTYDDPAPLLSALTAIGGPPVTVRVGSHEDMPAWLAAADWGLVIRAARWPALLNEVELTTKFPEYLASGLPVIVNRSSTWLTFLTERDRLGLIVSEQETEPIALMPWAREERERLVQYASANYSLESVAAAYLALYARVCPGV